MTERTPGELAAQIAALDDERAVQVLALAVHRDRPPVPPDPHLESHLRDAAGHTDTPGIPIQSAASNGDLARATLTYLAHTTPDRASDVQRAITLATSQPTERFFDPATLLVGGLVLLALQTEISLERNQAGRWRFRFHKQPISDTTLGAVLGKLIGAYSPTRSD